MAGEAGFAGNCDVIIVADVSGLPRSSNAWKSRPTVRSRAWEIRDEGSGTA
jgi:hypothetical protein